VFLHFGIAARDQRIAMLVGNVADLMELHEAMMEKVARLEHLLSRNSGNSSMPPSSDGHPGRKQPAEKPKRTGVGVNRSIRLFGLSVNARRTP
jgi:hypothetical protein